MGLDPTSIAGRELTAKTLTVMTSAGNICWLEEIEVDINSNNSASAVE